MGWKPTRVAATLLGLSALLIGVVSVDGSTASAPQGQPTCKRDGATIDIDPGFWQVTITREVDDIVLTYGHGELSCPGGPLSVYELDRIRLVDADVRLDFEGGPFAPGLTDEGDGSSEIEFEVDYGFGGELELAMTKGRDELAVGMVGHRFLRGINFNPGEAERDVDMTIAPGDRNHFGEAELAIEADHGPDRIVAAGGPEFAGPHADRLEIRGGAGKDLLLGGSGYDALIPGGGEDKVRAGGSNDIVEAVAGGRDRIDCGPGRNDLVEADRSDKTHSCKTFDEINPAALFDRE